MAKQLDSDLMLEARERYSAGLEADRSNRRRDFKDRKFYTGGDNQWPDGVPEDRRKDGRPCETYNRLPQFVKQVSGEVRQNKPAIKVLPVDGQTDPETAEIYSAIIRHIESGCDAHTTYARQTESAAIGGQGWWRIKSGYCDEASFEQELIIAGIKNPLSVVSDPAAQHPTRCDANWGFVSDLVPRKDFERDHKGYSASDFDAADMGNWVEGDFVRVAEYWRKRESGSVTLYALRAPSGEQVKTSEDELKQMLGLDKIDADTLTSLGFTVEGQKTSVTHQVESILLCGAGPLGEWQKWPGKYIPLIRVVGEEVEAGDLTFRHGMIHHAIPSQMAYNFARNSMMERHALSPKAPWLIALKQIPKAFRHMWETANKKNWPFLPYEPQPNAPVPQRNDPPTIDAAAYQESMIAAEDMKATTGIYDAALGAKSNETSGIAIQRRDAQGDTATYVYIDNMELAITATGRCLVDLIPHYYSDERVIRIIGEDGEIEKFAQINKLLPNGQKWNDVTAGKYDVVVTTGPAYATRRQEATEKLMQFVQAFPPLAAIAGDLVAKVIDVPMADKIAERLKTQLPPGVDPEIDQERAQQKQNAGPQPPSPQEQAMAAEQQAQQAKMQSDLMATQAKLQNQARETEAEIFLAKQKQDAELELAREKFEFEKQLAIEKAGLERDIAEHKALLSTAGAIHQAGLSEAKVTEQQFGGSVAE